MTKQLTQKFSIFSQIGAISFILSFITGYAELGPNHSSSSSCIWYAAAIIAAPLENKMWQGSLPHKKIKPGKLKKRYLRRFLFLSTKETKVRRTNYEKDRQYD